MPSRRRHRDRERLENRLQREQYQDLLEDLKLENAFLRRFRTWGEVIAFLRGWSAKDPLSDQILRPVFRSHEADKDPRWREILLAIFWPSLESIFRQKYRWDRNPDELWTNLQSVFMEAICSVDISKRPQRLAQKVITDTYHRLHDEYRCQRDLKAIEISLELMQAEGYKPLEEHEKEDLGQVEFEFREEREAMVRLLSRELEAGRITEADYYLLVGTEIYGHTVAECAEELGISEEAAKKRRQRALPVYARLEKKLSPSDPQKGLSLVRGKKNESRRSTA